MAPRRLAVASVGAALLSVGTAQFLTPTISFTPLPLPTGNARYATQSTIGASVLNPVTGVATAQPMTYQTIIRAGFLDSQSSSPDIFGALTDINGAPVYKVRWRRARARACRCPGAHRCPGSAARARLTDTRCAPAGR
jgi:hypothetical protein